MYKYKIILILVLLSFSNLMAHNQELLIDQLLTKELQKYNENSLEASWVYSNQGGILKIAELDLVGDERKELIYWRSTWGSFYKNGTTIEVYYQPKIGDKYIKIEGIGSIVGFSKKEGEKSIFLHASAGHNYETADEKPFTQKLKFTEVSDKGVSHKIHIIDSNTSKELYELWEATLFSHDQKFIKYMEKKGFTYITPKFKWVSLKDYLSGNYEWNDYDENDWGSLSEFSIESMTWFTNRKMITPGFETFARQLKKLLKQDEYSVSYSDLSLPPDYFTPKIAYEVLLKKKRIKDKHPSSEHNKDRNLTNKRDEVDVVSQLHEEEKDRVSKGASHSTWIIIGLFLSAALVFCFKYQKS